MKKLLGFMLSFSLSFSPLVYANDALLKEAQAGNAEAQFKVAAMYALGKLGNKSPEDREKMFGWLEKSAEQGFLKAQETLCKQYLDRCDYSKALKWSIKASEKGSKLGKATKAYLLYFGENVIPIDKTKAFSLIKECSSEPLAKTLLGYYYLNGWFDFETNFDEAEKLAKEAIKEKCSKAYELLNTIYTNHFFIDSDKENIIKKMKDNINEGIKQNPFDDDLLLCKARILVAFSKSSVEQKEGKEILIKLSEKDNKSACKILYEYELKINKAPEKALKYLIKASEDYCSDYPLKLFDLYVMGNNNTGIVVEKDTKKAREIALKAISYNNQGFLEKYIVIRRMADKNPEYKKLIGEAYIEDFDCNKYIKIAAENGSPAMMFAYAKTLEKDDMEAERLKYYEAAANMHWPDAQGTLAMKYHNDKDFDKSYDLAKKAYENKNITGEYVLGLCMFSGLGNCQKDEEKGLNLILSSISHGFDFIAAATPFNQYIQEGNKHFEIYYLGQLFLKDLDPSENAFLVGNIKICISDSKNYLSEEEIQKADKLVNNLVTMKNKSLEILIRNSLSNYGNIYF